MDREGRGGDLCYGDESREMSITMWRAGGGDEHHYEEARRMK